MTADEIQFVFDQLGLGTESDRDEIRSRVAACTADAYFQSGVMQELDQSQQPERLNAELA